MFGAAAMSISSFLVVTNALRLNLFNVQLYEYETKVRIHIKTTNLLGKLRYNKQGGTI